MKIFIVYSVAAVLLTGSLAYAGDASPKQGSEEQEQFQRMKKEMLKDLDAQLSELQKFRECISAAADHAGAKKCHEEHEAAQKSFREAKKQERLQRIEEQQRQLDKEKRDLQQSDSNP
jgi:N-methylhydantoinase B/oxoprolinase/acetone carboxylase alpha subunit